MKVAFQSSLLLFFGALLAHAQISSFKHVIVIVQENRTPDNLFQGLCASSLWYKRIVQHNPKCNPIQHSNQQLARQALADGCDATAASCLGKHLRSEALTRSFYQPMRCRSIRGMQNGRVRRRRLRRHVS